MLGALFDTAAQELGGPGETTGRLWMGIPGYKDKELLLQAMCP